MGGPWCTRGGGALAELLRDGARLPVHSIGPGGGNHRSRRGSPGCRSQVWGGGRQPGPSPQGQHQPPCGLFPALGAAGGWWARSWVGARWPSQPLARPRGSRHCRRSIARAKCPGSRSENNEEIQSARGLLRRHRLRGKPGPGSSPANAGVHAPAPRPARPRPLRPGGGDGGPLRGLGPSARPVLLQPSPAQDVPHAEAVRPAAACVGCPAASCPPRPPLPMCGAGASCPLPRLLAHLRSLAWGLPARTSGHRVLRSHHGDRRCPSCPLLITGVSRCPFLYPCTRSGGAASPPAAVGLRVPKGPLGRLRGRAGSGWQPHPAIPAPARQRCDLEISAVVCCGSSLPRGDGLPGQPGRAGALRGAGTLAMPRHATPCHASLVCVSLQPGRGLVEEVVPWARRVQGFGDHSRSPSWEDSWPCCPCPPACFPLGWLRDP